MCARFDSLSPLEVQALSEDLVSAVSAIVHDLASPLAAIQAGLTHVAAQSMDSSSQETVLDMQRSLQQLLTMRCQILDLYQERRGPRHEPSETIDLHRFARSFSEQLPSGLRARVLVEWLQGPTTISANPKLLRQAVSNLMENAAKYSQPQSPIWLIIDGNSDRVCLRVSNLGRGIPADERDMIFQPFYRCSNVRSTEGRGVGLAIVRNNMRQLSGHVSFESEPEGRTTFTLSFPRFSSRASHTRFSHEPGAAAEPVPVASGWGT